MAENTERDYVLGTHDDEIARLGFQHRVWRSTVLETWRRAGVRPGSRVLDVGAGPGFASLDLAEMVGEGGHVVAAERSGRFLARLRAHAAARGLKNISTHEVDLVTDAIPGAGFDAAWCRWVASFVSDPELLVKKIAGALRPEGVAVFHEYVHYETYALLPAGPRVREFVGHVMASWRDNKGEPNIAPRVLAACAANGLAIRETTPISFCAARGTDRFEWPAGYVRVGSERLRELGRVSEEWVAAVRAEVAAAEGNPNARFTTPTVLEMVVERAA